MGADSHPDQAPEVALKPEQPRMQQRMNCLVVVVSLFCITATVGCATLSLVSVVGQRTTVGIEYESAGRGDNVLAITYSSLCHGLLQTEKVRRYRHWTTCDLTLLRWVAEGGEYFPVQACVVRGTPPQDVQKTQLEVSVSKRYPSRDEAASAVDRAAGRLLIAGDYRFVTVWSRDPATSSSLRSAYMYAPPSLCPDISTNALRVAAFSGAILLDAVTFPAQVVFLLMVRGMQ